MASSTKSVSALQISRKFSINRKAGWLFMRKYSESLKSSQDHPINDTYSVIYVDEFVVGGYVKGQTGRSGKSKKRKIVMCRI
jgi:hypothetical protein